jgi:hypothetical protein
MTRRAPWAIFKWAIERGNALIAEAAAELGNPKPGAPAGQAQIQLRSFAMPSVSGATATITPTTTQNSDAFSKRPTLKFMPITPASSAPGSRMTEARVSTFMIWLVWCPPRAIRTSTEPTIASRASRASWSVARSG